MFCKCFILHETTALGCTERDNGRLHFVAEGFVSCSNPIWHSGSLRRKALNIHQQQRHRLILRRE